MSSQLFYRVYSPKSAGDLVCGKASQGWHRPSHINAEREFENHKKLSNREPTALVSVTSSIIRALQIAFNKEYKDKEEPGGIWIAIIKVPDQDKDVYHSAQEMARRCREQNPVLLKNEYLFEWEIPTKYVVHRVSAQTLLDRGLDLEKYCEQIWDEDSDSWMIVIPSTSDLRNKIANAVCDFTFDGKAHVYNSHDMFESHVRLAEMARAFGARAMGLNLPRMIFADCYTGRFFSPRYFKQRYKAMQENCDLVLLDWWLLGDKFNCDYECHLEHAAAVRETMKSERAELSENTIYSSENPAWFENESRILMEEAIEANAVRIGL